MGEFHPPISRPLSGRSYMSQCRKLHFSVAVRVFSTTQSTAWFSYSLVCKKVKEIIAEGAFHRYFHTAAFQSPCIGSLLRGADQGVFKLACHRTCNRLPYPCGQKTRHPPFGVRVRILLTKNFKNCCRCLRQAAPFARAFSAQKQAPLP